MAVSALDKLFAEQRAAADRIRALQDEIKATPPDENASVEVTYPSNGRDRYARYTAVTGKAAAVYAYCSHLFATDSCTPMYEHMLKRLVKLEELPDGRVRATLYHTLYAGD